ncbi:unnamed protein product, partial [Nesidiocoris tenuis]
MTGVTLPPPRPARPPTPRRCALRPSRRLPRMLHPSSQITCCPGLPRPRCWGGCDLGHPLNFNEAVTGRPVVRTALSGYFLHSADKINQLERKQFGRLVEKVSGLKFNNRRHLHPNKTIPTSHRIRAGVPTARPKIPVTVTMKIYGYDRKFIQKVRLRS